MIRLPGNEGCPMPVPRDRTQTRRAFLRRASTGIGAIALRALLARDLAGAPNTTAGRGTGVVNPLHHRPRAKRVIFLYMAGGPSHLETFDPKPKLIDMHGQPIPPSIPRGQTLSPLNR